ncbi:hypothetical protein KR018_009935 [Drosophila ironensis]|nr:hypothetical protein KR018_009935 [Drosophila ironensis]
MCQIAKVTGKKCRKLLPILLILLLLAWNCHVFVVQICVQRVKEYWGKVIYLLVFVGFLFLFLWTWIKCIFTDAVAIPLEWRLSVEDEAKLNRMQSEDEKSRLLFQISRSLNPKTCTKTLTVRYCNICILLKPDRAYHCRECGVCTLKRDHHCPWILNCVHFHNTKFFVLFLVYALLFLLYCMFVMLYYLWYLEGLDLEFRNYKREHLWLMLQHIVIIIMNISLLIMVLVTLNHLAVNATTIEATYPPYFFVSGQQGHYFNLGPKNNFLEVFGSKWYLWPIPIFTSLGNGINYPLSSRHRKVRIPVFVIWP